MTIALTGTPGSNGTFVASTTSPSLSMTSPADADVMIAIIGAGSSLFGGPPATTSVVWNSQNLTQVQTQTRTTLCKAQVWGLVGPSVSTTANMVTTMAQSCAIAQIAYFLKDANGTFTGKNGNNGKSTTASVGVSSTLTDLVIDAMCTTGSNWLEGFTNILEQNAGGHNNVRIHAQQAAGTSPTRTMSWTRANSRDWAHSAVSFKDAPAGVVTPQLAALGAGL